jgi:hypothetical protein
MYFLTVLEAEIQEEGAILVKVWRGPSAGLQTTDFTPLPCVKERERERERESCLVSLLLRALIPSEGPPTHQILITSQRHHFGN